MTLRTVSYDTETHNICPIEADEIQIQQGCLSQAIGKFANYEEWWNSHSSGVSERIRDLIAKDYRAMIAAAPEYQEPNIRAKLAVNMMKYLGATKSQAKAIIDGVFDGEHTINESDLKYQEPTKDE